MKHLKNSISAIALFVAEPLHAQESEPFQLGEIIVNAIRGTQTPVDEASVSVSVLSEEDVKENTAINTQIGDLLGETIPGFGPSTENLTDYGQSLRGRNFLTLVDGIPQTNTLNNDFRALNSVGLSSVKQVEVIRGATAAYGFGGSGGLVNIITKTPEDGEDITELSFGTQFQPSEVEDTLSYSASALTASRIGDFDYLISVEGLSTGGSFTPAGERRPPDSFGSQGGLDDVESYTALLKAGYGFGGQRLEFSANIYDYEQDSAYAGVVGGGSIADDTSATPSEGDLNTRTPGTENKTFSVNYTNDDVFGSTLDVLAYFNDKTSTFTRTEFGGITYPQYETESQKLGARITLNSVVGNNLDLAWGVDVIRDETVVNPIDEPYATTPDMQMTGAAPFLQATFEGSQYSITGGLRYEVLNVEIDDFTNDAATDITGGTATFREPLFNVSGSYDVSDAVTVYGGYAQTFQLGALSRALADSTFDTVDEIDGEGQRTHSYELGLRGEIADLTYSAVAFYSESNAGETYDETLDLVLAREEIKGLEVALDYTANAQWAFGGTASLIEGRYDTDGDDDLDSDLGSDRIAPTKLTAYAAFSPSDASSYRVNVMHSGERNPDSDQFTGLETIESYTIVGASARYDIGNGQLRVGIDNLFDTDYVPVLQQSYSIEAYAYDDYYYVKGAGRSLSLNYTVSF